MTHRYYIYTDSGQYDEFSADSISDALEQVDVPESVTDADSFCRWLERVGGYGSIQEDGVIIAEVRA